MRKPYIVLGVNYGGHDTSAAVMRDGCLVAASEQERYSLDKHSRRFPLDAIQDSLGRAGITLKEIDELAFAFLPVYHIREAYLRPALEDSDQIKRLIENIDSIQSDYYSESLIRNETGYEGKIKYYHHHLCHLASSWYPSGFSESLVVSYDGIGEIETGLMAVGKEDSLEVFHDSSRFPDSLGLLYSAITAYLGWRHHCDEGIVMGLASYGDPYSIVPDDGRDYYEVFCEIVQDLGGYDYCINKDWIAYQNTRDTWVSEKFYNVFGPSRSPEESVAQRHMDLAAALQLRLETIVCSQLRRAKEAFSQSKLCLSGGVALNCSLNGKIASTGLFEEIFVQPASGDAGVAIGACYLAQKGHDSTLKPKTMHNFYMGSEFTSEEMHAAFKERGLSAKQPRNLSELTATRLADGKIIGWFQGSAEFGPRALGNRSILTRPFPVEMKNYLNSRVKFREEFRPFAPAVLFEYFDQYFDIKQESPHMLIACNATPLALEKIPATIHVDNTCRVQTVKPENNERFYQILSEFNRLTGCPVLLNTSFNIKGQPIVNSPTQAIDCYLSTNIDCLVIGDLFVEKDNELA
jgi:carbamoyltransferase